VVNHEQAKRLKDAGFPIMVTKKGDCKNCGYFCKTPPNDDCPSDQIIISALPDEKQMMEFLRDRRQLLSAISQIVFHKVDITEALVQACCKVLEGEKHDRQ